MTNDISIGEITIYLNRIVLVLGAIGAFILCNNRAKKRKMNDDIVTGLFLCTVIGGIGGAKLLYCIYEYKTIMENPSILLNFSSGFKVYGGVIAALVLCFIYCKAKKVKFVEYLDLAAPSISLTMGFAAIGSFFSGNYYGMETSSAVGVTYKSSSYAPTDVKLIPIQLFFAIACFIITYILCRYAKTEKRNGEATLLTVVVSSMCAMIMAFYVNNYVGTVYFLSTAQCVLLVISGLALLMLSKLILSRKDNEDSFYTQVNINKNDSIEEEVTVDLEEKIK